jgi:hypothetical protein
MNNYTTFDEYIAFPTKEYYEVLFSDLIKLLGGVDRFELCFELEFPMTKNGSEILNEPPTPFESPEPLKSGKNYRFTIKVNDEDEIIFFINGKERSRKTIQELK